MPARKLFAHQFAKTPQKKREHNERNQMPEQNLWCLLQIHDSKIYADAKNMRDHERRLHRNP